MNLQDGIMLILQMDSVPWPPSYAIGINHHSIFNIGPEHIQIVFMEILILKLQRYSDKNQKLIQII